MNPENRNTYGVEEVRSPSVEPNIDGVWRFFSKWTISAGSILGVPVRIHILNIIWVGLFFYDREAPSYLLPKHMIYISVIFALMSHEMCHALVARHLGNDIKGIVVMLPLGAIALIRLISDKPLSRLAITLSGPLINLLTAFAIYLLWINFSDSISSYHVRSFLRSFIAVSLAIGVFNLIPLYPMDGGRIFKDVLLLCKAGSRTVDIMTLTVSFVSFAGLAFLSIKMDAFGMLIISVVLIIVAVLDLGLAAKERSIEMKEKL